MNLKRLTMKKRNNRLPATATCSLSFTLRTFSHSARSLRSSLQISYPYPGTYCAPAVKLTTDS